MTKQDINNRAVKLIDEMLYMPFEYIEDKKMVYATLMEIHGVIELVKVLTEDEDDKNR